MGGFQQDNPEFRNMDEYLGALQRIGMYAEQSPEMLKIYLQNEDFKPMLERLGYTDADQLYKDAISGKFTPDSYVSPDKYGQMAKDTGKYYSGLDRDLKGYENALNSLNIDFGNGELTPYGEQFNFNLKDISHIPDEAYQGMLDMQNEQAAQGFQGALNQLGERYGAQGFRPGSGFEQGAGSSLGRSYLDQLTNISRDVGMQKAQSKMDLSKFTSAQDLQRQQLQAQENQMRNAYLTDLQKYAKNFGLQSGQLAGQFGLQKAQTLSGMATNRGNTRTQGQQQQTNYLGMQQAGAMAPYTYGQQYYGGTAALTGPENTNVFEEIMGGIGTLGGVATGIVGAAKK